MNDTSGLRAVDYNGFQPGPPECDECPECLREDPAYRAGYNQAILDMVAKLAEQAAEDLEKVRSIAETAAARAAAKLVPDPPRRRRFGGRHAR